MMQIFILFFVIKTAKNLLLKNGKNEITFLLLHSYLFTPFTKGIYNLMIKNNL